MLEMISGKGDSKLTRVEMGGNDMKANLVFKSHEFSAPF